MPGTRNRANYPGLVRLHSWRITFYCPFTGPAQFLIAVKILMLTPTGNCDSHSVSRKLCFSLQQTEALTGKPQLVKMQRTVDRGVASSNSYICDITSVISSGEAEAGGFLKFTVQTV